MARKIRLLPFLLATGRFKDSNEVRRLLDEGRIRVGERVVHALKFEFRPTTEYVFVDGDRIEQRQSAEHVYYMFNKPQGVICQKNDDKGRPSVWQYLRKHSKLSPDEVNAMITVGRLDIDTEGLLLLTTDRALVNEITQPSRNVEKEYYAVAQGFVSNEHLDRIRAGMPLRVKVKGKEIEIVTKPAYITVVDRSEKRTKLRVVITEGKNRQVRLMLRELGHEVLFLQRTRVGNLELGKLKLGHVKALSLQQVRQMILKK